MKKLTYSILLTLLVLTSCKKESLYSELSCDYQEELLLNFGFEGVSLTQDGTKAYISGIDTAYADHNNWDEFNFTGKGEIKINYEDGDISERIAELVPDPQDPLNTVLHYNILSPNVKKNSGKEEKARIQTRYFTEGCVKEYYQKVDIYLPAEMAHLKEYEDVIYWLSIFEFWNNANWSGEKNPFRVTVGIHKKKGAGNDLHFEVEAQEEKASGFKDLWVEQAENFPIPFETWMELELYLLEGDANNGKFYMSVTPEGGSKIELFDITNITQHPKEKNPDGFSHNHPLKWYTNPEVVNHMKDAGYGLEIYWDNWRLWKNKQP